MSDLFPGFKEKTIPGDGAAGPFDLWMPWCDTVSGAPVDCGHFLAEENPVATLEGLVPLLEAA